VKRKGTVFNFNPKDLSGSVHKGRAKGDYITTGKVNWSVIYVEADYTGKYVRTMSMGWGIACMTMRPRRETRTTGAYGELGRCKLRKCGCQA
jgi:hypothetical protein